MTDSDKALRIANEVYGGMFPDGEMPEELPGLLLSTQRKLAMLSHGTAQLGSDTLAVLAMLATQPLNVAQNIINPTKKPTEPKAPPTEPKAPVQNDKAQWLSGLQTGDSLQVKWGDSVCDATLVNLGVGSNSGRARVTITGDDKNWREVSVDKIIYGK